MGNKGSSATPSERDELMFSSIFSNEKHLLYLRIGLLAVTVLIIVLNIVKTPKDELDSYIFLLSTWSYIASLVYLLVTIVSMTRIFRYEGDRSGESIDTEVEENKKKNVQDTSSGIEKSSAVLFSLSFVFSLTSAITFWSIVFQEEDRSDSEVGWFVLFHVISPLLVLTNVLYGKQRMAWWHLGAAVSAMCIYLAVNAAASAGFDENMYEELPWVKVEDKDSEDRDVGDIIAGLAIFLGVTIGTFLVGISTVLLRDKLNDWAGKPLPAKYSFLSVN